MSRIDTLTGMLERDPNNSRYRYMLAMEHVNAGELESAAKQFDEIVTRDNLYSAAYFHGGQTLEKLGRLDDARSLYLRGIEATTQNGDTHTRSELQGALDMLG